MYTDYKNIDRNRRATGVLVFENSICSALFVLLHMYVYIISGNGTQNCECGNVQTSKHIIEVCP